jgi:putative tryptophan/tyrosine transport system substrate-binding protein
MKRRDFITLVGGVAAAWPLKAQAQQPERMARIGVMLAFSASDPEAKPFVAALKKGLQDLGWIEGRNIEFDFRWPAADPDRIRAYATELVDTKPSAILVNSTAATAALQQKTLTVPVVFVNIADPIRSGFVASLAAPGGNITGFTNFETTMGAKWLELLRDVAPERMRAGLLFNPNTHSGQYFHIIETTAPSLGMESSQLPVQDAAGIERAIASLGRDVNAGLIVLPDIFHFAHCDLIVALAAQHRLPAIYPFRLFVTAGGLISYGIDLTDLYLRAASYLDRILKGSKPADLPIQQPTKFELVINLKTAKALGLTVPPTLLARADEVIE